MASSMALTGPGRPEDAESPAPVDHGIINDEIGVLNLSCVPYQDTRNRPVVYPDALIQYNVVREKSGALSKVVTWRLMRNDQCLMIAQGKGLSISKIYLKHGDTPFENLKRPDGVEAVLSKKSSVFDLHKETEKGDHLLHMFWTYIDMSTPKNVDVCYLAEDGHTLALHNLAPMSQNKRFYLTFENRPVKGSIKNAIFGNDNGVVQVMTWKKSKEIMVLEHNPQHAPMDLLTLFGMGLSIFMHPA